MVNLPYELHPVWTDWLEEQEHETALLKFILEYPFLYFCPILPINYSSSSSLVWGDGESVGLYKHIGNAFQYVGFGNSRSEKGNGYYYSFGGESFYFAIIL